MELSASRITCYLDCPLKWKFRYVDKLEAEETQPGLALGSSFHRTVKHFYTRLMTGQRLGIEDLEVAFIEDWQVAQTVPIKWNGSGPEEMEQQGLAMLRAYTEAVGEPVVPAAVEMSFKAPLSNLETGDDMPDVELIGIIDRVNPDDMPVEFKTSSKSWAQMQVDQSLQMSIYSYFMARESGRTEMSGRYEIVVKNKQPKVQTLQTTRDARRFDQMFRTVQQVVRCISDGIFYPKPSFLCPSCDYCSECYRW